jgi:Response regulators consisting of a CheY-like receiver domain and a winged-helix DNA-binding domain
LEYSSDTDTHTVETHIYRLRQKIKKHFNDDSFIKNSKEGYSL